MHGLAGRLQILTGVEMIRMLRKVFTDHGGHGKADIGVDIDLADGAAGSLAKLLFRNADGTGHISAVLVDDAYEFLRNRGGTVQHDRETGQLLGAFFQHVKPELRFCAGLEFVGAVAGADGDSQRVAAGAGCEINNFFWMRIHGFVGFNGNFIFHAGQRAEFCFDHNTVIMRIFNNFTGEGNIFFIGLGRSVDHNGGETAVNTALAELEAVTVVQMQSDRDFGIQLNRGFHQLDQVGVVGIGAGPLGNLQNDGSLQLAGSIGNALDDLHVVDVERADCVSAVISFFKHFSCGNKCHGRNLLQRNTYIIAQDITKKKYSSKQKEKLQREKENGRKTTAMLHRKNEKSKIDTI